MKRVLSLLLILGLFITPAYSQKVVASWYGPGFHGRKTASGERFNQYGLTAAHKTLPFGTIVAVTHKGRTINVRINDRGPFIKGRSLDLSKGAARALGCKGICVVSMRIVSVPRKYRAKAQTKKSRRR